MPSFTIFFAAVALAFAASLVVASNPDVPLCIVQPMGGNQVNLSNIPTATYKAQLASSSQGLINVSVVMGWCKTIPTSATCNNESLTMAIVSADGKQCIAAFSAVSGPVVAVTNNSFQITEWSSDSGSIATVTVNCNKALPNRTAAVTSIISNSPFFTFSFSFDSPEACGSMTSSSESSPRQPRRDHFFRH